MRKATPEPSQFFSAGDNDACAPQFCLGEALLSANLSFCDAKVTHFDLQGCDHKLQSEEPKSKSARIVVRILRPG
jgi:hypothetical protein